MNNYLVKINNVDDDKEFYGLFEIIFTNDEGKKLAYFCFDMMEITNDCEMKNFNELKDIDKANMLKNFSCNVSARKDCVINFIITNGEMHIKISNGFMEFQIEHVGFCCEFVVAINEQLINEFQQNIFYPLIEKFQLEKVISN